MLYLGKQVNDDEDAHPDSSPGSSSSAWFLGELEFGNVGFWEKREKLM